LSRYFFYLFLICMLINTIFFVPRILLEEREGGAIMALAAGTVVGTLLAVVFTWAIQQFPGEGAAELFSRLMPAWIRIPLLLFFSGMWAIAGAIILIAFSFITNRYLSPETGHTLLLLCFCGLSSWAATRRPLTIINVLEVTILVNLPVVLFIMYKSVSHPLLSLDSVKLYTDYIPQMPSWTALAAATYPFTGYINLAVYNRLYKELRIRHLWLIPLVGSAILFVSFFIPIAIMGAESVDDYLYTWIATADTIRMELGFIERVVYLFLFIYIGFSLLFVTVTWNIAILLIRSCFPAWFERSERHKTWTSWSIALLIALATGVSGALSNDKALIGFTKGWLAIRLGAEVLIVTLVVWAYWRLKHAKAC